MIFGWEVLMNMGVIDALGIQSLYRKRGVIGIAGIERGYQNSCYAANLVHYIRTLPSSSVSGLSYLEHASPTGYKLAISHTPKQTMPFVS